MKTSFLSNDEIRKIGFREVGKDVFISRHASFYSPENIVIGHNVRIDDFCIISGQVLIGNYIHISSHTVLTGGIAGIEIQDFANFSQRVNVFANSDDYSGRSLTNPMVSDNYKKLEQAKVTICKHVIIGCGSVILPGVTLNEGTAIGALSLINRSTDEWTIYAGIPAKPIKIRSREALELEIDFLNSRKELTLN